MNLQNIMSAIEEKDPEAYERLDTRRKLMKNFARISGKLAAGTIPFALGSMFQKLMEKILM